MKCNVKIRVDANVDIKPCDMVTVLSGYREGKKLMVKKIVETKYGIRVIFTDGTWRPISTYGNTWM